MFLYKIDGSNLEEIKEKPFSKEVELHKLCESNLKNIFDLKFVRRKFSLNNFSLDTLAFEESSKSFVIIEYKNTSNFSVIDQGDVRSKVGLRHNQIKKSKWGVK